MPDIRAQLEVERREVAAALDRLRGEEGALEARLADLDVALRVLDSLQVPAATGTAEAVHAPVIEAPGRTLPVQQSPAQRRAATGGTRRPSVTDQARPRLLSLVAAEPERWWSNADFTAALPDRHPERVRQLAYQLVKSGQFRKDGRGRFQWAGGVVS